MVVTAAATQFANIAPIHCDLSAVCKSVQKSGETAPLFSLAAASREVAAVARCLAVARWRDIYGDLEQSSAEGLGHG